MIRNRLFTFIAAIICLVLIPAAFHTSGGEASSDPSLPDDLKVTFSEEAGANITGKTVELYAPAGCTVWYTTDGSDPAAGSSNRYTAPLSLTPVPSRLAAESDSINLSPYGIYDPEGLPQAVTVKAIAAAPDGTASPAAVRTYFFQDIEPVTVISIATDYDNLLNNETGIMVKGAIYDSWAGTEEAKSYIERDMLWEYQGNYSQKGKAWERPASIEIFDGGTYVSGNCGIRLCGHYSRVLSQKSFNIYFRKDYGTKELKYPLFPDAVSADGSTLTAYKSFKLRSGGNHTEFLKFPDTMIQYLVRDLDFATQSARPAILYLNGEYMGIYVMMEKYSDSYIADHFGVDKDNVIIIEEGELDEGEDTDIELYNELQSYADKDFSDPEVYKEFCNTVDIGSMADYYATEIYIANYDWDPTSNTRLWRVRTPENDGSGDGRWRWMLYDTEQSASLYGFFGTAYYNDSFSAAINNDPLFAAVIKNEDFFNKFTEKINRLASDNFAADKVKETMDGYAAVYKPYMPLYYQRFGDTSDYWDHYINEIGTFFENRAAHILPFVRH